MGKPKKKSTKTSEKFEGKEENFRKRNFPQNEFLAEFSAQQTEGKLIKIPQLHFQAIFEKPVTHQTASNIFGRDTNLQRKGSHFEDFLLNILLVGSDEVNLLQSGGRNYVMVDVTDTVELIPAEVVFFRLGDKDEGLVIRLPIFACGLEELVQLEGFLQKGLAFLEGWKTITLAIQGPRRGEVFKLDVLDGRVQDTAFGPGK